MSADHDYTLRKVKTIDYNISVSFFHPWNQVYVESSIYGMPGSMVCIAQYSIAL